MNPAVYRLLDVNLNRAREALRVLEDVARFVLDDPLLVAEFKTLRHDLAAATRGWEPDGLIHRDTPGDVGTSITTAAEQSRADVTAVAVAAGKRLGEALRSIEEFGKVLDPAAAAAVEAIRYRTYELERRLRVVLDGAGRFEPVRLYVLITESACKWPWKQVAEAAVAGGAHALQLREKELDGGELLSRARWIVDLCKANRVISIINDRIDVAIAAGADGVHVGQTDLPAAEVRKLVGRRLIVGVSTHTLEQARQAAVDGADYIGCGPVFPSPTKPRPFLPGLGFAAEIASAIRLPAVAIAGITPANLPQVLATGMTRVAVTSAVTQSDDPARGNCRLRGPTAVSGGRSPSPSSRLTPAARCRGWFCQRFDLHPLAPGSAGGSALNVNVGLCRLQKLKTPGEAGG